MWQLEGKMKKILFLVLFLFSCNTEKSKQSPNIPVFDSNQAFTYLEKHRSKLEHRRKKYEHVETGRGSF